jgi:hypothetical protein
MTNPGSKYLFLTEGGILDDGQEELLAELRTSLGRPGSKLLLHLHGGLIDVDAGRAIAERLGGSGASSWDLADDWTQVYVAWRTGVFETIRTNWTDLVHDDRLYQTILRKLIGFAARKLGLPSFEGRSLAAEFSLDEATIQRRITGLEDLREPFSDVDAYVGASAEAGTRATLDTIQSPGALALEFQDELGQDTRFAAAVADLDGVVNEGAPGRTALPPADRARGAASFDRLAPGLRQELTPPPGPAGGRGIVSVGIFALKHSAQIALRCFRRFRDRRDHGLHATIVEELCRELYGDLVGAKVWGMMVRDAADHFEETGFGPHLLATIRDHPPGTIVVTAHSAGSIWASRMLLAMKAAGIDAPVNLFLLAPAVRSDLFAEVIDSCGTQIGRCRMVTMDDEHERRDAVLGHDKGYIYPSSLLYLVAGLFEKKDAKAYADAPLLGMQRFANVDWLDPAERGDADKIAAFFQQPGKDIVHSPSPDISSAIRHGDFDDDPETLASVRTLFAG